MKKVYIIIVVCVLGLIAYNILATNKHRESTKDIVVSCITIDEVQTMYEPPIESTPEPTEEPTGQPTLNTYVVPEKPFYDDSVHLERELQQYIYELCEEYSINHYLIFAIIEKESNYNIAAMGDNGESYGLMQIKKKYQKDRMKKFNITDLNDPYNNVLIGIDFLSELFEQYNDLEYVLHYYNGGGQYADSRTTTSEYAKYVINRMEELSND